VLGQREQFLWAELLVRRLVAEREGSHTRDISLRTLYDTVS